MNEKVLNFGKTQRMISLLSFTVYCFQSDQLYFLNIISANKAVMLCSVDQLCLLYRGKNKSNENFKTTIPSKNYDRPKTTRECGIF